LAINVSKSGPVKSCFANASRARSFKLLIVPTVSWVSLQSATTGKDSLTGPVSPRCVTLFLFRADFLPHNV
jgi:hypothetical protein